MPPRWHLLLPRVKDKGSKTKRNLGGAWNSGCQAADFKIGRLSWIIQVGSVKSHTIFKVQGKAKEEGIGVM